MIASLLVGHLLLVPVGHRLVPPLQAPDSALALSRLTGPIELDGIPSDPAWLGIAPLPLVMYEPTTGAAPSARSEIRIGYDESHLYAAARFWVDDPAEIRGFGLYRDRLGGDDYFRLTLDTFNDRENAVAFATSPSGLRSDHSIGADGREINMDWNGHWEAVARRHPDGWSAELRIPFSTLRFETRDGRVLMRLLVARWLGARNELDTYPSLSPEFANAPSRPSLGQLVSLEGIRPSRPAYVTPYALGSASRLHRLNQAGDRYDAVRDGTAEAGVDVKYGLSNDLALDLTVNTDFAQVEADDQQINLSRFGLFFPEKRQFFQERSGLFSFTTGGFGDAGRLFHSRRIGLDDSGVPLRIFGGGRLVGRLDGWDVGALAMQVDRGPGSSGSEHFGVYRVRRPILNPQSYLGGIATVRLGSGRSDLAYGVDAQVRTFRNDFLSLVWAQTFNQHLEERGLSGALVRLGYERRSSQGLVYNTSVRWSGRDHEPAVGFTQRRDVFSLAGNVRYGWYPGSRTVFRSIQPSLNAFAYWRNSDGGLETSQVSNFLNYELKGGIAGYAVLGLSNEGLIGDLVLGPGVTVPAGRYRNESFTFVVNLPQGWPLRSGLTFTAGELYDGSQLSIGLSPTWNVAPELELGADLIRNRIAFSRRDVVLDADLARLRVRAALDTRVSLNTYVQYNRATDQVVSNVRFRYNFAEGRDLFLVYNDRLNTDRARFLPVEPELPGSAERVFAIKYSHTLAW